MLRLLSVIVWVLLTGCDLNRPDIETDFSDYLNRIANIQNSPSLPEPPAQAIALPDKRALFKEPDTITLGLFDSYELRKCGLFNLIAERNSVLGKVQDQFHRFDYEIRLLNGLHLCVTAPDLSPGLRDKLNAIEAHKRKQLPVYWANLLYTSTAMRSQLSSLQWYHPKSEENGVIQALALLQQNQQWMNATTPGLPPPGITTVQEVLEKRPLTGEIRYSLDNSALWLNTITRQLNRYDSQIICGPDRDTT